MYCIAIGVKVFPLAIEDILRYTERAQQPEGPLEFEQPMYDTVMNDKRYSMRSRHSGPGILASDFESDQKVLSSMVLSA